MKGKFKILFPLFVLVFCIVAFSSNMVNKNEQSDSPNSSDTLSQPFDLANDITNRADIKYNESHLLAKINENVVIDTSSKEADNLGINAIQAHKKSDWVTIELKQGLNASNQINILRSSGLFSVVDFDYIYESDTIESNDTTTSINNTKSMGIEDTINLNEAYKYMEEHGGTPGGDPSVVIAVLDTGIDYTHPDLKDNIWTNSAEIPGDGIDNDGNGYIDDTIGWNCVGNNNDPMDDNGHGTHVAGIIGAEKNDFGTTGVAYNCKIMPVKCGNSSNTFNNSDIAEGIRYAYMNGADIISMSIGGSSISLEVQEALEDAYTTSFLVAAAGNDSAQNQYRYPGYSVIRTYPASFSFVCGVMSNNSAYYESWFTNFDTFPNNSDEYEIYAPGEAIYSTYPNNRYTTLNGTSMATPVVSGVAALIRSMHPDKEMFSTKFLFSQIVNTSDQTVWPYHPISEIEEYGQCVDAYAALSKAPVPNVKLYDYYTFDDEGYSLKNNGDKTINSGETIRMGLNLINKGGSLSNTTITVDANRDGEGLIKDPYISFSKNRIDLDTIGTYSNKDTGLIYDEDGTTVIGTENYLEFTISDDCPDEYSIAINVGVDGTDHNGIPYHFDLTATISVSNRILLPSIIDKDTTLTSNRSYLLLNSLRIMEGATLTIEPGVDIQVYNDIDSSYYNEIINSPTVSVWGTLNAIGTENEYIDIHNADWYVNYMWRLITVGNGQVSFEYTNLYNVVTVFETKTYVNTTNIDIKNSNLTFYSTLAADNNMVFIENGMTQDVIDTTDATLAINSIKSSNVYIKATIKLKINTAEETMFEFSPESVQKYFWEGAVLKILKSSTNCVFLNKNEISINPFSIHFNLDPENTYYYGNYFTISDMSNFSNTFKITADGYSGNDGIEFPMYNMIFGGMPDILLDSIFNDFFDSNTNYYFSPTDTDDFDISKLPPFVQSVTLTNSDGEEITVVGKEDFKVQIDFNRSMDTSLALDVAFGSVRPYADYVIDGEYVTETTWIGYFRMDKIANASYEGGYQHFSISNARAKDNHALTLTDNGSSFTFTIDTSSALSMSMQAISTTDGVKLTWMQDDYATLMGYNVYRSEKENGEYTKLNNVIIPKEENSFIDENAEPGKTYYYVFTVVFTDLTESIPSGKTQCTVSDNLPPSIYHTPVNQGYINNNLLISITASDNIGITSVKLYYRVKGESEYKVTTMARQNDKFTGKINANELSLDGIEYYIEVSDGNNITSKGSAEEPYTITIKESPSIILKGDVDGNGVIDIGDALMMKQSIEGTRILSHDEFGRADLNGDGEISSLEVLMVLQYINGNINSL